MASVGPSAARTQVAALGGAKRKAEDAAARSVSAAASGARGASTPPLRTLACAVLSGALALLFINPSVSSAQTAPAWSVDAAALPSQFSPTAPENRYTIVVANTGSATAEPGVTLTDRLPAGLTMTGATGYNGNVWGCEEPEESIVVCTFGEEIPPATHAPALEIEVSNPAETPLPLRNEITVSGGGALHSASVTQSTPVGTATPSFAITDFEMAANDEAGASEQLAGGHPWQVSAALNFPWRPRPPELPAELPPGAYFPVENIKRIAVELPAGVVGNLFSGEHCLERQLYNSACPRASQVGIIALDARSFTQNEFVTSSQFNNPTPLYNMPPTAGYPAEIGFAFFGQIVPLYATVVHSPEGERVRFATPPGIPETLETLDVFLTLFGRPGAINGTESPVAAITDPGRCGEGPQMSRMEVETWANPGHTLSSETPLFPEELGGCEELIFEPTLMAIPTTGQADSPTGLGVDIHVPQPQGFEERATPPLRDATVTLPQGLVANPALADGLGACQATGPEGINLGTDDIGAKGQDLGNPEATELGAGHAGGNASPYDDNVYHTAPGHCPASSVLGTVEVSSPIVAQPLYGHVYLGAPACSPCTDQDAAEGKLIHLYIEAEGDGAIVKLPGTTAADPATGQLTATFRDNPQLPFEELAVDFKKGPRAPLATPATCGRYTTTTDLKPWSSKPAPGEVEGTPDATPASSFEVSAGPGGGACVKTPAEEPNKPAFTAGTTNPSAGAYAPFELEIARADGSQRLKALDATLPAGLTAKLAGVGECSEPQIAAAPQHSGKAEQQSPSCPLNTEVGTVNVGAGAGPNPFHVQGHAYLAGPYKSAPISIAAVVPAVAGPFDLGTVVVRTALYVDPETAVVSAHSDPFPQILAGIPLDLRSVVVNLSRPSFTLNPTSCNPSAVTAGVLSALDQSAPLSNPFQVGGCKALAFKPKLALSLEGGTRRTKHPALKAVVTYPKQGNYANIARAQVSLPHSEFLDQAHIGTVCTRVQFDAGNGNGEQCPAASIYGHATATTPLLDQPLSGPVYLRSSSHKLPDLVAALGGQINVDLAGKVDTGKNGGIRNTFEVVPDAPVAKFVLTMKGGSKGLLVNSENICSHSQKALAHFVAQNGKVDNFKPTIANSCKSAKKHHVRRGAHR